jgi:DNA polymerase V
MLIRRPAATFWLQSDGDSMKGEIKSMDYLAVDRSLEPQDGDIVVATVNGAHTVKRFARRGRQVFLVADNPAYPEIEITAETDFQLFGVAKGLVRVLCRR